VKIAPLMTDAGGRRILRESVRVIGIGTRISPLCVVELCMEEKDGEEVHRVKVLAVSHQMRDNLQLDKMERMHCISSSKKRL